MGNLKKKKGYDIFKVTWKCVEFNKKERQEDKERERERKKLSKETRIERDMCTPMFIAALFPVTRTWKQPRCPSADEWIRKQW